MMSGNDINEIRDEMGICPDCKDHTPCGCSDDPMDWDDWKESNQSIQDRVEKYIRAKFSEKKEIVYSAYQCDKDGVPIDNLDEVPVVGTFRVVYHSWMGNGLIYCSDQLTDPTWLDLSKIANDAVLYTEDMHHVYFESIYPLEDDMEKKIYKLSMGS